MTLVIKAPCGCACTMFVDGERQRVIHQSWCRTKGHRTMGAGHVIPRTWRVAVRGGVS